MKSRKEIEEIYIDKLSSRDPADWPGVDMESFVEGYLQAQKDLAV